MYRCRAETLRVAPLPDRKVSRGSIRRPAELCHQEHKDAHRAKIGRKAVLHPLSSAFVRFQSDERPLAFGSDRSLSFAYIRFRSHTFAYDFFSRMRRQAGGRTRQFFVEWWRKAARAGMRHGKFAGIRRIGRPDPPRFAAIRHKKYMCARGAESEFNHGWKQMNTEKSKGTRRLMADDLTQVVDFPHLARNKNAQTDLLVGQWRTGPEGRGAGRGWRSRRGAMAYSPPAAITRLMAVRNSPSVNGLERHTLPWDLRNSWVFSFTMSPVMKMSRCDISGLESCKRS